MVFSPPTLANIAKLQSVLLSPSPPTPALCPAYLVPLSLAFDDMEGPHAYTFFTYLNIVGSECATYLCLHCLDCFRVGALMLMVWRSIF